MESPQFGVNGQVASGASGDNVFGGLACTFATGDIVAFGPGLAGAPGVAVIA